MLIWCYVTEHAIPTLFKKYMQVGADTARKYGGTGLGLAICKQLVIHILKLSDVLTRNHGIIVLIFIALDRLSLWEAI